MGCGVRCVRCVRCVPCVLECACPLAPFSKLGSSDKVTNATDHLASSDDMATSDLNTATAEAFLHGLAPDARKRLRTLVATDRAKFSEEMKASGCAKMGVRLKVELLLQQQTGDDDSAADDSDAPAVATDVSDAKAPPIPATLAGPFVGAAAFVGARKGYAFKMGPKGVGYYADDPMAASDPATARLVRGFTGNLSWLSDEPSAAPAADAPAASDAAASEAATSASAKLASTALIVPGTPTEPIQCKDGRLSDRRRAVLEKQSGPFAPDLRNGKYADKGQMLRINGKSWGLCEKIELHTFYCRHLETGSVTAHSFQELETTDMSLQRFLIAKQKWEVRAPLAQRTLRDDRKGQVHKSWTGPPINQLRLTDKPAPGKGYYYGVVPSTPVLMPPKIDPSDVTHPNEGEGGAPAEANATGDGSKAPMGQNLAGEYYYAHRRKIDFKIPTPTPQRIDL